MVEQPSEHQMILRQTLSKFLVDSISLDTPEELLSLARSERVETLYLTRLQEDSVQLTDEDAFQALKSEGQQATAHSLLRDHILLTANTTLRNAGITPIWIKGVALSHTVYDEAPLRSMTDLDLIVVESEYEATLSYLRDLGYADPAIELDTVATGLSHHVMLQHQKYPFIVIELHSKLLGRDGEYQLPKPILDTWLRDPFSFEISGNTFYTLQPPMHLLYICAHGFLQHGEYQVTLRDLLDVHLLVTHYDLDWDAVIDMAATLNWTFVMERALQLTQEYYDTPLPDDIFERLQANRSSSEDVARVMLKAQDGIRGEGILQVVPKMSLPELVTTIYQIAMPPRNYMRQRYDIPENERVLPYYIRRWWSQLGSVFTIIIRRLRIRFTKK